MGGSPDMEFFSLGMYASLNLVLWGTVLLATYIGLKLSKSTAWNPKVSVVSINPVSAFHSHAQQFLGDDYNDDDNNINNNNNNEDSDDLMFWK